MAVKTITISGKDYDMKSSAYTMFSYKNDTGKDMLKDIMSMSSELSKLNEDNQDNAIEVIEPLIDKCLRLAYIMIKEQNKDFKTYEEWLKDLDGLLDDGNISWITEVLELGISPIRRGIFSSPKQ